MPLLSNCMHLLWQNKQNFAKQSGDMQEEAIVAVSRQQHTKTMAFCHRAFIRLVLARPQYLQVLQPSAAALIAGALCRVAYGSCLSLV